jgi:hypothetical protein
LNATKTELPIPPQILNGELRRMWQFLDDPEFWSPIVSYWLTVGVPIAVAAAAAILPSVRKAIKSILKLWL